MAESVNVSSGKLESMADGTQVAIGALDASAGVGYPTGIGGAVTQITNRSTGVTLNKLCGTITTDTTSLAAAAAATFTVTNSKVAISDVISLNIRSGQTNTATRVSVSAVAAGSFDITMVNQHASVAETGAAIINFTVHKAVAA